MTAHSNNSPTIRLRAMELADLEFLYSIENDSSCWDAGATSTPYSHDLLRQYLLTSTCDIYSDKQVRLIITADDEPVGIADLSSFDPKNLRAEVGIIIKKERRHQGIASRAMALLEDYSVHTIHLHQLYAVVPADNFCSHQLFQKRGFTTALELKEWVFDGKKYRNAWVMQKFF